MPDELSVAEAADVLGTSGQTIRNLLGDGTLRGRRGERNAWLVSKKSVDAFLTEYGRLDRGRRRKGAIRALEAEVKRLTAEVESLSATMVRGEDVVTLVRERDELRARVVSLEDALAQMREAADLQRRADVERAELVEHLLAAVASAERADAQRRQAIEQLEGAVARAGVPGYLPDDS